LFHFQIEVFFGYDGRDHRRQNPSKTTKRTPEKSANLCYEVNNQGEEQRKCRH
jgi:hypothetical protein